MVDRNGYPHLGALTYQIFHLRGAGNSSQRLPLISGPWDSALKGGCVLAAFTVAMIPPHPPPSAAHPRPSCPSCRLPRLARRSSEERWRGCPRGSAVPAEKVSRSRETPRGRQRHSPRRYRARTDSCMRLRPRQPRPGGLLCGTRPVSRRQRRRRTGCSWKKRNASGGGGSRSGQPSSAWGRGLPPPSIEDTERAGQRVLCMPVVCPWPDAWMRWWR